MKISTFMCVTNPEKGNYPYLEAIESHLAFSDEFVLVDGNSTDGSLEKIKEKFGEKVQIETLNWPQGKGNWTWEEFALHWNFGLQNCKDNGADWVCAAECDHIFHEDDARKVRERLEKHSNEMIGWVDKLVSSTWYKWESKSKFAYFLNVGQFPELGYGMDRNWKGGQDLANPIQVVKDSEFGIPEGFIITHDIGKNLGLYFWNYDKTFKTKENILKERDSANWAWNNSCLVKLGIMPSWEETDILGDVIRRMKSRFEKSNRHYILYFHPKVMKEKLETMDESMLGYNLFGEL